VRAPFSRATPGVARSWGVWEGGAVRAPFSRAAPGAAGSWDVCGIPEPPPSPDDAASQCSPVRETVYFVLRCASALDRQ